MSDFAPHDEDDLLAAEYALGLLEGEALLGARGRVARDPAFAAAVAAWERRLAPLAAGFAEVEPPAGLWSRIEEALQRESDAGSAAGAAGNVVPFRERTRLWRGWAAGMTALAAALALVLALQVAQPDPPPSVPAPPAERQPALVASLASEDGSAAVAVAFDPQRGSVTVAPARLSPAAGHDHELWLIPAGGTPVSLGLVAADGPRRLPVPREHLAAFGPDASVAISVEPAGGSPTGQPTGPVIASGSFAQI